MNRDFIPPHCLTNNQAEWALNRSNAFHILPLSSPFPCQQRQPFLAVRCWVLLTDKSDPRFTYLSMQNVKCDEKVVHPCQPHSTAAKCSSTLLCRLSRIGMSAPRRTMFDSIHIGSSDVVTASPIEYTLDEYAQLVHSHHIKLVLAGGQVSSSV